MEVMKGQLMKNIRSILRGAALLLLFAALHFPFSTSLAQSYSIDWYKVAGGGGTSTNGQYSLSGTIGQHDASLTPMTGGGYSLTGGFWSLFAVQTPGAPLLTIFISTTNTAVVYWPSPSTGFNLQQNLDLTPTNWVSATNTIFDNGASRFIIVSPPAGNRFYRLKQ
jgi:hypothetical protein